MAQIPATPQNFVAQTGNVKNLLSWDLVPGATAYSVQRSTDGTTYSVVSSPAANYYEDVAVTPGILYYYQIASVNVAGTSPYTAPEQLIPAPSGEMSLAQLRLSSQQRADRVNSEFVTKSEWNTFINQAMFELYDLLITTYEGYFTLSPVQFTTNGSTFLYPLPDGINTFTDLNGATIVARPMYKLDGVDLGLNTANNAWVTVDKFNFISRNDYVYPNSSSTIYGVFNCQYRLIGNKMEFIPTPSANQSIRIWYTPRLEQLLKDTDITTIGYSGWLQYVIVRAAKYALDKEESDTQSLDSEILFLKTRIEESASNRDQGRPDTISNVRSGSFGMGGPNGNYGRGGW